MEVLRRRRWLTDLKVVFGAQLQEPFDAGARVLGALAFVPVRQEQRQSGEPPPFIFGRRDALIDDHLRIVREIAELRLPQHQRFGVITAVAVLEADDGCF
jgi:hypothetical protein